MATNQTFVTQLYQNVLFRTPSAGEVNYWVGRLDFNEVTQAQVAQTFITSAEAQGNPAAVIRLYQSYFGRVPALNEVAFHVNNIRSNGATLTTIAQQFSEAQEFTTRFPAGTNDAFVTNLYQNVLGRTPSSTEISYYNARLAAGESRGSVALSFNQSPEFTTNYGGVVNAALANAGIVGSIPTDVNTLQQQGAVNLSTLTTNLVANPTGGGTGAPGQTFTLTAGADTITGTNNNDIINALTVNASGAAATTLSGFDTIDGGAGTDTLNIYANGTENPSLPASASIKNVEVINIYNDTTAFFTSAGTVDASKFSGATQVWQHTLAVDVSNLAATTTAGFKGIEATVGNDTGVSAATGVTTAAIALNGVLGAAATAGGETENQAYIEVGGDALAGVTVTGTLAQKTTTAGAAPATLALAVTSGKDVQTVTLNTAVATVLTIAEGAGSTKEVTTVDLSTSTGGVTYAGTVTGGTVAPATIKGGTGNDTLTIVTATLKDDSATTAVDETRSALLDAGAGDDTITINTSGTGTTTVNAGDGKDVVTLTADGDGKLSINLGAGNDTLKGAGAVTGTDAVDAGEGTDTLLLSMVGSANIGAFSNFETFDVAGLAKTLDVGILGTKNTVTEFVTSADVGAGAVLTDVGTGVGYRVIGDTDVANALTLTQATAGALTVTLDIDETATTAATTAATDRDAAVTASNATSIKAVFGSAFVGEATGAGDNATNLVVTGTAATTLEVVSGGANALNDLDYTTATAESKAVLTSATLSGDRALDFDVTISGGGSVQLATVNASAMTGALTFGLNDLKAAGTLTLGSGADVITAQTGVGTSVATILGAQRYIAGFQKGSVENATAQGAFDVVSLTAAVQAADDTTGTANASVENGRITFKGAGPATLEQAVTFAQALIDINEAAVFEYLGNSYIFAEGGTDGAGTDVLVRLTGVTGLTGLDTVGTDTLLYVY
jgi:hypothetical protein